MTYSLFISEQKLKEFTPIDDNVEVDELRPFIIQAQDLKIQSLLGTDLYFHLMNAVNLDSLTNEETNLIKYYIQPLLANYTIYLAIPSMTYKIMNKAIMQLNSEESSPIGLDVVKYLRDSYKNNSDFYQNRLADYLCDYNEYFPLYTNPSMNGMHPMGSKNYAGFYLPKTGFRRPNGYDKPTNQNY